MFIPHIFLIHYSPIEQIMRPTTDKFMIIYHSNGTEANRLNITDPNIAIFSTSVDRTVTVTWGGSSGKFSFFFVLAHLRVQLSPMDKRINEGGQSLNINP